MAQMAFYSYNATPSDTLLENMKIIEDVDM